LSLSARLRAAAWPQPNGANDAVRVAVVGLRSKGAGHIRHLLTIPGVRIVALCDVDPSILAREVELMKERHIDVFATTDARKLMSRSDIDAVVIATGTYWHALLTIWACQAGKDVYVEKPVSHTVWEGSMMVRAAARYQRIVQAGTQLRSDPGAAEAVQYIKEGHLGKIQWIHTLCYKLRESIGRKEPWYPDWLDYDLFCGPAPMDPLERNRLHYDWHWMWSTGNGDMADLGIHVLDFARRFGRRDLMPRRSLSLGGRFGVDDVGETPNTQVAVFDCDEIPIFYESRGLPAKPGVKYVDQLYGLREGGVIVQCEGGYYAGFVGGAAYDRNGRKIRSFQGDNGAGHMANFLTAVRSRRKEDLAAPISTGHESTSICYYGNISYRLGRPAAANLDQARQALEGFPPAEKILERMGQHLGTAHVDLTQGGLTLGPWLQLETAQNDITRVEGGEDGALERARFLLREVSRPPYVIPDPLT